MHRRHPRTLWLPRLWLITDERQGGGLWRALDRLPSGAGIVFRHYSLPLAERRALFTRVRRMARKRGWLLLLAGRPAQARAWGADGHHGLARGGGLSSASVHNLREIRAAERAGAAFIFLGPVFATRSHPDARTLGPLRFSMLAGGTALPVIALGGMDAARLRRLGGTAYGWAGIDAWS
jgi:thiamine-phosphate pyrophosphorylase